MRALELKYVTTIGEELHILSRKEKIAYLEKRIKRKLRSHVRSLGFAVDRDWALAGGNGSKDAIRLLHSGQREERLAKANAFLAKRLSNVLDCFASGREVEPKRISPRIQLVCSGTKESDLFRVASLTWSVPVSEGYGRRMRFIVWDDHTGKIIGIVALGDPVFNLRVRDDFVAWSGNDRKEHLINVLDAYVLGAVPPYSALLGGKLVACAVRTKEVRDAFRRRYGHARGVISGKEKDPKLVLVTTTSALGRSSIYNRLRLDGTKYFQPIGFTSGYGHFHVDGELFDSLREYLRLRKHSYSANNRFGNGPNWKFRAIRAAFELIGIDRDLLHHGVRREVFVCPLAENAKRILRGEQKRPNYNGLLSMGEVGRLAIERWIVPRAERRPEFLAWQREGILDLLGVTMAR